MNLPRPTFYFHQRVFLKVGELQGMVRTILYAPGHVLYGVMWEDGEERYHYEAELSESRAYEGAAPGTIDTQ